MKRFIQSISKFHKDESGQDLIEYALIGTLIALGAVSSLRNVASGVTGVFVALGSTITGNI